MARKDPFKVTLEERDKMSHYDLNVWYSDYGIKVDKLAEETMGKNNITGLIFCGGEVVKKLKNYEEPGQKALATLEKKYGLPCYKTSKQAEGLEDKFAKDRGA